MYHEKPGADSSTRPRIFMYHNMEASGGNGGFDHNSIMRYGGPTNKTTWLSEPNVGDIISQYGYEAKVGNWICNLFIMHKHPQGRAIITQFTSQGDRQHALHNLRLARRNAGATKCVGKDFQGKPHGGMRIILGFGQGGARCCIVGIAPVITLKTLMSRPTVEGHKWEGCNQLPLSFQLVSHNRGH
jgi:hypothetical protein